MRKSQAALEFLTTYAWAFLVIIIMVGALAYFGVLSPSKLLPDRCNFGSEITCNKDVMVVKALKSPITTTGSNPNPNEDNLAAGLPLEAGEGDTLAMRIENNFGIPVRVTDAKITTDVTTAGTCTAYLSNQLTDGTPGTESTGYPIRFDPGLGTPNGLADTGTVTYATPTEFDWKSDETITFIAQCTSGSALVKKEKVKFNIEVNYYPATSSSSYGKIIFGEVFTTAQ